MAQSAGDAVRDEERAPEQGADAELPAQTGQDGEHLAAAELADEGERSDGMDMALLAAFAQSGNCASSQSACRTWPMRGKMRSMLLRWPASLRPLMASSMKNWQKPRS